MLLEDVPVAAFKLGILGGAESMAMIAEILSDYPDIPVILDPVLASGRGDELATDDMIAAMRDLLIPQTSILTPNSHEARRLASFESDDDDMDLAACARHLTDLGCEYVLITGTRSDTARAEQPVRHQRACPDRCLGPPARQLSRLGLHACLGHRRSPGLRAGDSAGGA